MSKRIPKCHNCGVDYLPINSVDEDGNWDGNAKQNCDCESSIGIEKTTIPPEIIDTIKREVLFKIVMVCNAADDMRVNELEEIIDTIETELEGAYW